MQVYLAYLSEETLNLMREDLKHIKEEKKQYMDNNMPEYEGEFDRKKDAIKDLQKQINQIGYVLQSEYIHNRKGEVVANE